MIPSQDQWEQALTDRHGSALQKRFSSATVAVCGLGGLGSNIAIALARAGVGKLILIDFDTVDITNLHRQQYKADQIGRYKTEALKENILEIAPYIDLELITARISEEAFTSGSPTAVASSQTSSSAGSATTTSQHSQIAEALTHADIICEAFDHPVSKAMLVNHVLEHFPGAYLVAASGMAGMETPNTIRTRRITKRFYLCGDETSDVADSIGLVAPRVMICAAHQAHTVLRILAGEYEP